MYRGLLISSGFHVAIVMVSILALPFVAKKPLDIPPLISVELIQIAEKTNIPFAPKASKIIEKAKKENEKLQTINNFRKRCQAKSIKFYLANNESLAIKIKADGCHMGQKDGSFKIARKKLKNKII